MRVDEREFVLADLPGLIEGAHEGVGLGDRFLGHTERCRVILHLVDGTCDDAGRDYRTVRGELEAYGQGLTDKPEIVALTKADAMTPDADQDADGEAEEGLQEDAAVLSSRFRPRRAGGSACARQSDRPRARGHRGRAGAKEEEAWQP